MSEITQAEISRVVRGKMRDNFAIIQSNARSIQAQTEVLLEACDNTSMEDMSHALRQIVDAAIACRARMMYMRGCWAVGKGLRREPPQSNNESNEGLD